MPVRPRAAAGAGGDGLLRVWEATGPKGCCGVRVSMAKGLKGCCGVRVSVAKGLKGCCGVTREQCGLGLGLRRNRERGN